MYDVFLQVQLEQLQIYSQKMSFDMNIDIFG